MLKLLLIFVVFIALFTARDVQKAYNAFMAWIDRVRNGLMPLRRPYTPLGTFYRPK
jgi:Sec-independent protein translocase protein TatA